MNAQGVAIGSVWTPNPKKTKGLRIPTDRVLTVSAYDPNNEKFLCIYEGSLGPYKSKKKWMSRKHLMHNYIMKVKPIVSNGSNGPSKQVDLFQPAQIRIADALERIASVLEKGLRLL